MTNHNAYYIQALTDSAWRNIENYFAYNPISISEITGIGDFGGSKNILFEEFNDSNELSALLPTEDVAYEPTDVTIKLVISGNSNNKPTIQAQNIVNYCSKGIKFKDTFRQLGNILYLQDTTISSAQINLVANSASASEYCLLNLKFKKKYAIDIPIVISGVLAEEGVSDTTMEFHFKINENISISSLGFISKGVQYKTHAGSTWTTINLDYDDEFSGTITGLTAETTYDIKAFYNNVLENYESDTIQFKTLA